MKQLLIFLFGSIAILSFSCSRNRALEKTNTGNFKNLEKKIFALEAEKELPKDNLPSERIQLEMPDRILFANWVSAGETAPAIFILHGNGETLSDWRPLQAYLFKKGYSSFVFDYTGFGSSTGVPGVQNLNDDAIKAYAKFASLTLHSNKRIAFAHSLGCAVLLEDAMKFKPAPGKVVTHGAFSTLLKILIEKHYISDSAKSNYPDVWNGLKNIKKIKLPVYIVHSIHDKTIPIAMSKALKESAGNKAQFLQLETPNHNAVYESPTDSTWDPIFNFINK